MRLVITVLRGLLHTESSIQPIHVASGSSGSVTGDDARAGQRRRRAKSLSETEGRAHKVWLVVCCLDMPLTISQRSRKEVVIVD